MKIMIAGDTHGDLGHLKQLADHARESKIGMIIQLGDFGFWEHTAAGRKFMSKLQKSLEKFDVVVSFIDGNHDNHRLLWDTYGESGPHVRVRDNIWYEPRGATFELGGITFQTVGGAFSPDVGYRVTAMRAGAEEMWWPEEELTDDQVSEAVVSARASKPKVMLTHDAPDGCPMELLASGALPPHLEERSRDNQLRLRQIVDAAQPDYLLHGHYHVAVRYDLRLSSGKLLECVSVGHNQGDFHDSYVVLDTSRIL